MSAFRTSFTAIAAAMLAVACGGGGGGGSSGISDGGGGGGTLPPEVLISAANQDTVARASIASITPFVSVPLTTGAAPAAAAAPRGGLTHLALRSVKSGVRTPAAAPAGMARPQARYEDIAPCTISGSVTVVLDDSDNNMAISAGDSIWMSFNQCVDDVGVVLNGGMGMAIGSYALTPSMEDLGGSMTFESLTMVDSTGSIAMNGGFSFRITATLKPEGSELFGSFTVAGAGLTVSKQGGSGGLSDVFTYRPGYTVTDRDFTGARGSASWEVVSASGKFHSGMLAGELGLSTTTPFKSTYMDPMGDIFPTEGQLIVTGRDNTKLGLTATQTPQVRTDMCDNGDDKWESSKMVTWDWLHQ